jgi:hypothetical protein
VEDGAMVHSALVVGARGCLPLFRLGVSSPTPQEVINPLGIDLVLFPELQDLVIESMTRDGRLWSRRSLISLWDGRSVVVV